MFLRFKKYAVQQFSMKCIWNKFVNHFIIQLMHNVKYAELIKNIYITSSVYDCTVEDVEHIYNKLIIHIQQQKYSHRLYVL